MRAIWGAGGANGSGYRGRDFGIGGRELNVIGDKDIARAGDEGSKGGVEPRWASVGVYLTRCEPTRELVDSATSQKRKRLVSGYSGGGAVEE